MQTKTEMSCVVLTCVIPHDKAGLLKCRHLTAKRVCLDRRRLTKKITERDTRKELKTELALQSWRFSHRGQKQIWDGFQQTGSNMIWWSSWAKKMTATSRLTIRPRPLDLLPLQEILNSLHVVFPPLSVGARDRRHAKSEKIWTRPIRTAQWKRGISPLRLCVNCEPVHGELRSLINPNKCKHLESETWWRIFMMDHGEQEEMCYYCLYRWIQAVCRWKKL